MAPAAEYLPAAQTSHLLAPTATWKLPAAQGVHEVTSPPAEYVPAMQVWQEPDALLNEPALQTVVEQELAPTAA